METMRLACSWNGQVSSPFLKIGFSFVPLRAFGKTSCEVERFQSVETGFANMLAYLLKTYRKFYLPQQL